MSIGSTHRQNGPFFKTSSALIENSDFCYLITVIAITLVENKFKFSMIECDLRLLKRNPLKMCATIRPIKFERSR